MLKKIIQNQWVIMSISITSVLILLIFSFLILNIRPSEKIYVIHYKAITGIDLFGSWWNLYFLGIVALIIAVFHLFLAMFLWDRNRTLCYFLLFVTPFLEIIILLATICLISINK